LRRVAFDPSYSAFARTGAIGLLGAYPDAESLAAIDAGVRESSPLIRMASLHALQSFAPAQRASPAASSLDDPVRSVRIEAVRTLAAVPVDALSPIQMRQRERGLQELIAAENASAERPEAHANLATVFADLGRMQDAETELTTALRLDPRFVPAMVNLADIYSSQNKLADAKQLLTNAIGADSTNAAPQHLLGLLLVRERSYPEALPYLERAARLAPGEPRYAYVYAVALHSLGRVPQAIEVLAASHRRTPADRDVLTALVLYEQERGRAKVALGYVDNLLQQTPDDPTLNALRQQLKPAGRGPVLN